MVDDIKKDNWFVHLFRHFGGALKTAGTYIGDFAEEVFKAFLPILKGEAGKFVALLKDDAIRIAIAAASAATGPGGKVSYFAVEIGKAAAAQGIHIIKDHLVNLLREVVVAELKEKKIIP